MLTITDACTDCGACSRVCPAHVIGLGAKPVLTGPGCIRCGHCEAVCPHNALQNSLVPQDNTPPLPDTPVLDPDTAALFLRSRRSTRCYLPKPVPRELTQRLLEIGRYAQTAVNSQGVTFLVLSTQSLENLRKLALEFFRNHPDPLQQKAYEIFTQSKRDVFLRGAPMCILALTKRREPHFSRNAIYALTYVEAMAPSLGLGTCWAGYLERYTSADAPEMRALLEIPDDLVVSGALLYGYPQLRYHRAAARDPLAVLWR